MQRAKLSRRFRSVCVAEHWCAMLEVHPTNQEGALHQRYQAANHTPKMLLAATGKNAIRVRLLPTLSDEGEQRTMIAPEVRMTPSAVSFNVKPVASCHASMSSSRPRTCSGNLDVSTSCGRWGVESCMHRKPPPQRHATTCRVLGELSSVHTSMQRHSGTGQGEQGFTLLSYQQLEAAFLLLPLDQEQRSIC